MNIELNALKEFQREFLERTVEQSIRSHVDEDAKQQAEREIRAERDAIARAVTIDGSELETE